MMINSAMIGGVALEPRQRNQSLIKTNACGGIELTAAEHTTTVFLFASILRSDPASRPILKRVTATCEHEARRQLVREYVLMFAGRVVGRNENA